MQTLVVFLQLAFCALVATGAAGWGVYSLRTRSEHSGERSDGVFWNSFLALTILLPAVLIPAVASPLAGAAVVLVALTAAAGAYRYSPVLEVRRRQRRVGRVASLSLAATASRHERILAHWQQYELDLARVIDYPPMSDVRVPATAAVISAMRAAELARPSAELDDDAVPASIRNYDHAVARLGHLLAEAELASGVPELQRFRALDVRPARGRANEAPRRLAGLV
ncbi:MAG TPA: hypothetical protein VGN49_04125 [Micrococcaceae bacterium]|jgi:hypothetical protein|nr:hypothetical protein [Micrococcaceae bacterium]